jgi:hypothetical protein
LTEVYLKINGTLEPDSSSLWIGLPSTTRVEGSIWVAEAIHNMKSLSLQILRVSNLGYDGFDPDNKLTRGNYDLADPSGLNKSFDMRFVEAASGRGYSEADHAETTAHGFDFLDFSDSTSALASTDVHSDDVGLSMSSNSNTLDAPEPTRPTLDDVCEYDAETFQTSHNTTNHYKKCIDGYFFNHNEQALKELQQIIQVADRGMTLLSAEIDRTYAAEVNTADGTLVIP